MFASVARWGNSLALRIPSAFARELDVKEGAAVEISVAGGALVVRPVEDSPVYDLDDLLSRITDGNRHGEVATGEAVGNEV
ncbi:MAG: AbrB/MazE/SpoVT family DNA-binding domain-containing protein [Rhizobiaceae bacterium]